MTNKKGDLTCTLTCWAIALLTGILVCAALMILAGWTFLQGLFMGVVAAALLGIFLSIAICKPLPHPSEVRAMNAPAAPKASAAPKTAATSAAAVSTAATAAAAMDSVAAGEAAEAAPKPAAKPAAKKKAPAKKAKPAKKAAPAAEDFDGDGVVEGKDEGTKPATLSAARDGKADDLKKIKGVGPKMEKLCNKLGFYHFDQIASWTKDEVAWVDANLEGFRGRVTRDEWVKQAKLLAAGGETEFSKKVDKGNVY